MPLNATTTLPQMLPLLCVCMFTAGCRPDAADKKTDGDHAHDHDQTAPRDRLAIPSDVRRNLGITFIDVEKRPVRRTIRIAGQFELRPEARREYHVMLSGRITLLVRQYDRVVAGQPLFHLESPEWQQMQNELVATANAMKRSHAEVAVSEAKLTEMKESIAFLDRRIANLAEANVRQVELEAQLAEKRSALPRLQADVDAMRTEFDTAHTHYEVMLSTAASMTGIDRESLDAQSDDHHHSHASDAPPPWRSIQQITVRAEAAGVVDRIAVTNRGWAEAGALVLDTVVPTMLRFHADALQTDINLFEDGQSARITPPQGGSIDLQDTVDGVIQLGIEAHAEQRTVPIYLTPSELPTWAKSGVTAYLEVFVDGSSGVSLAIPEAAIVRDGLDRVFFRRDPNDPNQVLRVVADLGATDGRWTEVLSGVRAGDQVVLEGVYPLMLSMSSGGEEKTGFHVHADGSVHDDH